MYYVARYTPSRPVSYNIGVRQWQSAVNIAYNLVQKSPPPWASNDDGDCALEPVWCGPECWNEPGALGGYEIREGGDGDKHVAAVITEEG